MALGARALRLALTMVADAGGPGVRSGLFLDLRPGHDRALVRWTNDYWGGVLTCPDVWALMLESLRRDRLVPSGAGPEGRGRTPAIYTPCRPEHDRSADLRKPSAPLLERRLGFIHHGRMDRNRSASVPPWRYGFGNVYDPVRRRMLVHGGIRNGIEPDDLWALTPPTHVPAWRKIETAGQLRGRSFPRRRVRPDR